VVAQTIIGKDGTVEQVHVISGDPHLRDAAIAAIEKWRYRPYLLNGRPAPVETTVTVDFRLNR
jgi:protein TonB